MRPTSGPSFLPGEGRRVVAPRGSSAPNLRTWSRKRGDLVLPPPLINLICETRGDVSLSNEILMTLKPGALLPRYGHSLHLIFINVDNSLHGPYGGITSTLKFNFIFRASLDVFCRIIQSGASAVSCVRFIFIMIWNKQERGTSHIKTVLILGSSFKMNPKGLKSVFS